MAQPDNIEIEIELTYLARRLPKELRGVIPVAMVDVYVPDTSAHPQLRLRQKEDHYEITKKQPINGDASRQTEQTIPLEAHEFEALSRASTKKIEKLRYKVSLDGRIAEVDVFSGPLSGLVLIDFEFDSYEAQESFIPPKCCLANVTHEKFIAGGILAGQKYEDIDADLKRYDYTRIQV